MPEKNIQPDPHDILSLEEQIERRAQRAKKYLAQAEADSSDPHICIEIELAALDVEAHVRVRSGEPAVMVARDIEKRKQPIGVRLGRLRKKEKKAKRNEKREWKLLNGINKTTAGAIYAPQIYGETCEDGAIESVCIRLSLCSTPILRYNGLHRWNPLFDSVVAKLDSPPLLKGGCYFGNFTVPVIATICQDAKRASYLSLFAVDDPKDLRLVAVGRLTGNNDILRFDFTHRNLTIHCTHAKADRATGMPHPLPFDENFNLRFSSDSANNADEQAFVEKEN